MTHGEKWKMCSRKKAYSKSGTAHKLAARCGLWAYECPLCRHWHLTSKAQR